MNDGLNQVSGLRSRIARRWRYILISACIGYMAGYESAKAQSISDSGTELRREQERIQAQRQRAEKTFDIQAHATQLNTARLSDTEFPCFTIDRLELSYTDNHSYSPIFDWVLASTSGPKGDDTPVGKCLGAQGIELVLKRAQASIVQKGFVTTRVLAQNQNLSSGTLVLTVIPGHVNTIRFKGAQTPPVKIRNAVPIRVKDILNLREIEQSLENFKRVPTAEVDIQIEPAQDPSSLNQSDLVISYQQQSPARFSFTADDSGSKGTGKYQGSSTLSLDNPLSLSDLFYFTGSHDMGGGSDGTRGTRGYTAHYSLPMDYWTLGTTYTSNRYFQNVAGQNQDYVYSGTSENSEIKLARIVYRDSIRKTSLSLKGWQRKSNNYIDDTEVLVQRRVAGGWELGVNHKDALGDITLEGSLAYKRGTKDFESIPAPEESFGEGTSKLGLLQLDFNASKPFKAVGQSFRYSVALRLQDNTTPLTPQDRFAIGGRYTARGFDGESSLVGERGWTLRNDWSMALGGSGQEVYLGLDAGEVGGPSSEYLAGKHLAGGVIGLKGSFKRFKTAMQYDLFVGGPIEKPAGFKTAQTIAGFSLSLSY